MHLIVCLRPSKEILRLPMHYNRLIQAAIYTNLGSDLAEFLHGRGFTAGRRSFKLFTFSRMMGEYRLDKAKNEIIFFKELKLVVSSPLLQFCTSLLNHLLTSGVIYLGEEIAEITGINVETPKVVTEEAEIRMLSPVVVYSTFLKPEGGKYTCYFQPGEGEFTRLIESNLRKKYEAFYQRTPPAGEVKIRAIGRPKFNLVMYKDTPIKGYTCRLKLTGPPDLLQMGVDAGLGSKGSQGFGCVEMVRKII
ncbi:CRISPR-associated protein Cas6 [Peptococcaceae bacterium SCADC1_2_3]|nr:CRISPR-associated protein Cas6 [Peptococcaceae bacterium SCADC1_2_3]KFI35130.1 CRISPR-associated protein Cas6 [Peptococcaceae bacterium SCADC1_2_3]